VLCRVYTRGLSGGLFAGQFVDLFAVRWYV
jgi:hypothetical protein